MKIFSLGEEGSVYTGDFVAHRLPERVTETRRQIERLKESGSRPQSTDLPAPPQILWWRTPCLGMMKADGKPPFAPGRGQDWPPHPPPSTLEAVKPNPLYPRIKGGLKRGMTQLDASMERWLEFSLTDYHKDRPRHAEEPEGAAGLRKMEELAGIRRHVTGYMGFIPRSALPVPSTRTCTLDPTLSVYEAIQVRNNQNIENTDPEIKKKYEEMPLNKQRITHGISYLPIEANYSKNLHNLPYNEYRK